MARPTSYTQKLGNEICVRLAQGESLRTICKDDHTPALSTVLLWVVDGKHEAFSEQYAKAREAQAEYLFDELLDIADDGSNDYMEREREDGSVFEQINSEHITRSRLRVDTRKWYLSKVLPKKYGDKLDVTSGNKPIQQNGIAFVKMTDATESQ